MTDDRTLQAEFQYSQMKEKVRVNLNSHKQWDFTEKTEMEFDEDDMGEAFDCLDDAIEYLAERIYKNYKKSGWWKQVERNGEDETERETYGINGIPGIGLGNIKDSYKIITTPETVKIYTVGSNKIQIVTSEPEDRPEAMDGQKSDTFQHMTYNEIKKYNRIGV